MKPENTGPFTAKLVTNWDNVFNKLDDDRKRETKMSKKKSKKAKRGRPPGSKNKSVPTIVGKRGRPKQNVTFADTLSNINLLAKQLELALKMAIANLNSVVK